MLLLFVAKTLVRLVPMRWWRASLGHPGDGASVEGARPGRRVAAAVVRAAERLPSEYLCLPRAMAVQWMLRRRGVSSALVLGMQSSFRTGNLHSLHAWVEAGGRTVIGADPKREYRRGLTLVQP